MTWTWMWMAGVFVPHFPRIVCNIARQCKTNIGLPFWPFVIWLLREPCGPCRSCLVGLLCIAVCVHHEAAGGRVLHFHNSETLQKVEKIWHPKEKDPTKRCRFPRFESGRHFANLCGLGVKSWGVKPSEHSQAEVWKPYSHNGFSIYQGKGWCLYVSGVP